MFLYKEGYYLLGFAPKSVLEVILIKTQMSNTVGSVVIYIKTIIAKRKEFFIAFMLLLGLRTCVASSNRE